MKHFFRYHMGKRRNLIPTFYPLQRREPFLLVLGTKRRRARSDAPIQLYADCQMAVESFRAPGTS